MEGEKRYSYIRKKWAKGSVGAIISSILSLCLFFLCLGGYSPLVCELSGFISSFCHSHRARKVYRKKTGIYCFGSGYFPSVYLVGASVFRL